MNLTLKFEYLLTLANLDIVSTYPTFGAKESESFDSPKHHSTAHPVSPSNSYPVVTYQYMQENLNVWGHSTHKSALVRPWSCNYDQAKINQTI